MPKTTLSIGKQPQKSPDSVKLRKATTGPNQTGTILFDWRDVITNINSNSYNSDWGIGDGEWGLLVSGTNYISVRVYDNAGNINLLNDVFYIRKDTVSPTIIDNQAGDDIWRNTNDGIYNVDFYDLHSGLDKIQIKITTGPNQTGTVLTSPEWTDYIIGIDSNSYTEDLTLPPALWNLLIDGTNYINLKVFDKAQNIYISTDVFYVKKDTIPPSQVSLISPINYSTTNILNIEFKWNTSIDNIGISGYIIDISTNEFSSIYLSSNVISTSTIITLSSGRWWWRVKAKDFANNYSIYSDTWTIFIGTAPPTIVNNQSGDDLWRNSNNGSYNLSFYDNSGTGLNKIQIRATQYGDGSGSIYFDWSDLITNIDTSSYTQPIQLTQTLFDLLTNGINYISVRVYDNAGNYSTLTGAFYVKKDVIPPSIVDNQDGDFIWRSENNGVYNVDFIDDGGSGLSKFQIRISTNQNGLEPLIDWTDRITNINSNSYLDNWTITDSQFNLLPPGTSYVSVRIFDNAGNISVSTDTFFIRKATQPVVIVNNQSGDDVWRNSNTGYYDIDFYSELANLTTVEILVSTVGFSTTTFVINWSTNILNIGATYYTDNWKIRDDIFDQLQSGVTNYISVRAFNEAGQKGVLVDGFYILKDTVPPTYQKNIDESVWYSTISPSFDLDIIDPFSGVLSFEVMASTNQGGASPLFSWSVFVSTPINKKYYTDNWAFPQSKWDLLVEGTTNYISLRIYDVSGNTSIYYDAFKVFKDTTPPSIINNQTGDDVWRSSNTTIYNVNFEDTGGSLLNNIYVRVSTTYPPSSYIINWTTVSTNISSNTKTGFVLTDYVFGLLREGTNYIYIGADDNAKNFKDGGYLFYIKKDTTPPSIPTLISPSNQSSTNTLSVNFIWSNSSDFASGVKGYEIYISTDENFSVITSSSFVNTTNKVITLPKEDIYYWKVRSVDNADNYSSFSSTYSVIVDTTPPQIIDNQSGDDVWISSNSRVYSVYFNDTGGSKLSKFQIKATTGQNQTGTILFDWRDVITNINSNSYNSDWGIGDVEWGLLVGGTNYISVRVYDNAGNVNSLTDVFYIRKDTVSPTIIDNQMGDDIWRNTNNGIYNVDFYDEHSGIKSIEIRFSTSTNGNDVIIDWHNLGLSLNQGTTYYTSDWQISSVDFNALPTNKKSYVSLRITDIADNVYISSDVFYIQKDTDMPVITDLQDGDTNWYRLNPGNIFKVYFDDYGVGLSSAVYKIYSQPGENNDVLISSGSIFENLGQNSYHNNWGISDSVWNLLPSNTSYVSVYVWDGLGYSTKAVDVFYIQKDTTPPSFIADLNAITPTQATDEGNLLISWSAPGDDGTLGAVKYYKIALRTDGSVNDFNFDTSNVFISSITPKSYGQSESLMIENLVPGSTYYVAIRAYDKAGNYSISNSTSNYAGVDKTPPNAITDLYASTGPFEGQIQITFTAPGDGVKGIQSSGTATGYIVKYSSSFLINETNFDSANTYNQTWQPLPYGNLETRVIDGLIPNTTYSIAIKAYDEVGNISSISNVVIGTSTPKGPRAAMVLYGVSSDNYLRYRIQYSTGVWSGEFNTNINLGSQPKWIVLKSVPVVRNQKFAAVSLSNGLIKILKYDGESGLWSDITPSPAPSYGSSLVKNFDIEFEQNSARLIFVYYNGTAGYVNYAIYSATQSAWVVNPTAISVVGLTGSINWVRAKALSGSDKVSFGVSDSNSGFSVLIWNGSSWIANTNLTGSLSNASRQSWDIAFETLTGALLALWGTGTTTNYRKYYSTSTWGGTLTGPNFAASVSWIRLCSDTSSNRIGLTAMYGTASWNVSIWRPSGTEGWSALPTADTAMSGITTRNTDCTWETNTGRFIVVSVDDIGTIDNKFDWITWQNGTWSPASPSVTVTNDNTVWVGSITYINLFTDPNTNNVTAIGVDASRYIKSTLWTNGAWVSAGNNLNFQHTNSASDFNMEVYGFVYDQQDNTPPTLTDNQSGDDIWRSSNTGYYSVYANDTGGSKLSRIETRIYTLPSNGGTQVEDWTPQVVGINLDNYNQSWQITQNTFDKLPQGISYVSVRAFDNAGNVSSVAQDAFYIKKDTTPPSIVNNLSSDSFNFWTSTGVGSINIDFFDSGGSGISTITYLVYKSSSMSGDFVGEFLISSGSIGNYYTTDWNINFSLLSDGTNYISVRVWDLAGSSTTLVDAFKVLKDTILPNSITDLTASKGPTLGTVVLNFTSPSDNGLNNTQGGYIIKYATYQITEALFNLATTYDYSGVPLSSGSIESIIVYDLDPNTTYYFAIKVKDKAGNLSSISNVVSSLPQSLNVFINEVYPDISGNSWVELYNNTQNNFNLNGWKVVYKQSAVDLNGTEVVMWSGTSTDTINSGSFKLINLSSMNSAQSYSVLLKNSEGKIVDKLQWPILSTGKSFSRVYDGSLYLEIDPTPTPGYANSISSDVKINEISYSGYKFIELYNNSSSTYTLTNFALRNKNSDSVFKFTRKIYPHSYTVIDETSISNDGYNWSYVFNTNLSSDGDFVVLENENGQTIDRVSWKGSTNILYDYKASLIGTGVYAPANSNTSIGRVNDGLDSDNDSSDFTILSVPTPFSRNSNYGATSSNNLIYPYSNIYLPSNFPIKLKLNSDFTGGSNDLIVFINTDLKDNKSPHIYRLSGLGFNLSDISTQSLTFNIDNFTDIDGNTLVSSATYKILLTLDNSNASSPNIWVSSITVDKSSMNVVAQFSGSNWLNSNKEVDIFKIDIYNPSNYDVYFTTLTLEFRTTDNILLNTSQMKDLFKFIKIIKDSNYGNIGVFEEGIDVDEVISLSNLYFDNNPLTLSISTDTLSFIPSKTTSTYFVVLVSSDNYYNANPNSFIAKIDLSLMSVSDSINLISQNKNNNSQINSSTITAIHPESQDVWSYDTGEVSNIDKMVSVNWITGTDVYVSGKDGKLRAIDYNNGNEKWIFTTSPVSQIKTSPLVSWGANDESFIYFVCENGDVYKVQDNGTYASVVWKTNIGTTVKGDLYDSDTKIYFGTINNKIYCLNKADGNVCSGWIFDNGIDSQVNTSLSIDFRNDVNLGWAGLNNGKVVAFRLTDGVVINNFLTGGSIYSAPFVDSAYSTASNNLYIASTDGKLYSRVASNLTVKPSQWNDVVLNASTYSSPYKVPYSTYVIIGDESGRVYKIQSETGQIISYFNSGYPIRTMPIEWNGTVYFASGKYIYALDLDTFNLKQGFPVYLGSEIKGEMSFDNYSGYLSFSTNAGKVFVIDLW